MTKQLNDSEKIAAIQKILEKHECWSGEQMFQSDYHSINGVEIIVDICKIVGYAKCSYDDENEESDD